MKWIPPPKPRRSEDAMCEAAGPLIMARGFDRQVAEFQARVVVLNGFTVLGIPVTKVAGWICPVERVIRSSDDLCNRALARG